MRVMSFPFSTSSGEYTASTLSSLDSNMLKPVPYPRRQDKAKNYSFADLPQSEATELSSGTSRFTFESIQKMRLKDLMSRHWIKDFIIDENDDELEVLKEGVNESCKLSKVKVARVQGKTEMKYGDMRKRIRNLIGKSEKARNKASISETNIMINDKQKRVLPHSNS
eukprot:TRINITY_DN12933_c0_g1_i1.p1 TRINITY_DN12933_c0_g1~~TRINITY_DN12933_c0_g1_i1.p1  ORF type:complete len:167 (+),score=30.39 TRINITY_DN12933_c0_g1_i1:557-1057(+)